MGGLPVLSSAGPRACDLRVWPGRHVSLRGHRGVPACTVGGPPVAERPLSRVASPWRYGCLRVSRGGACSFGASPWTTAPVKGADDRREGSPAAVRAAVLFSWAAPPAYPVPGPQGS